MQHKGGFIYFTPIKITSEQSNINIAMQAEIYKEDFEREREDREKATGRVESAQKDLASAREEVQAKVSQVKQYKKQSDTQEANVCLVIIIYPRRLCVRRGLL